MLVLSGFNAHSALQVMPGGTAGNSFYTELITTETSLLRKNTIHGPTGQMNSNVSGVGYYMYTMLF